MTWLLMICLAGIFPPGQLPAVFGGHVSPAAAAVAPHRDVHPLARHAMGDASLGGVGGEIEVGLAQLFCRQLTWRANNLAAYHDYVDDTIVSGDRTAYLAYVDDIVVAPSGSEADDSEGEIECID